MGVTAMNGKRPKDPFFWNAAFLFGALGNLIGAVKLYDSFPLLAVLSLMVTSMIGTVLIKFNTK